MLPFGCSAVNRAPKPLYRNNAISNRNNSDSDIIFTAIPKNIPSKYDKASLPAKDYLTDNG
jgi:hypothetical protein